MRFIDWFRNRPPESEERLAGDDDAESRAYGSALSDSPKTAAGLVEEASRKFREGDPESGVGLCQRALKVRPQSDAACVAAGRLLLQHGRPSEGEKAFRLALNLKPDMPEAHFYLASALRDQGRLDDAIESFRQCARLDPRSHSAHVELGVTYRMSYQFDEAIASCRRAIELAPNFAHAHDNLGVALWQRGKQDEAVDSFRRAISLDPGQASFHNNLGIVYFETGELEQAESHLLESLRLMPGFIDSVVNLATIYEATYRLDEAWARIEQGLSLAPGHPRLHLCAARCESRRGEVTNAIKRLTALPTENLPLTMRAQIESELANLCLRNGQHRQAFEYATTANRCMREVAAAFGIDKGDYLDEIDVVSEWLRPENTRDWTTNAEGTGEQTPVFLVGFPRSGTTLIDQMFDSHPGIQTLEEADSVEAMKVVLRGMPGGYPGSMGSLEPDDLEALRSAYFSVVDRRIDRKPGAVFIDKFPLNICNVALIQRVFPGAKYIFALRHPCDVCLSAYMQNFKINSAMACFLDLEDAATLYEKSMALWQKSLDALSPPSHTIRYEDLVLDIERHLREALEFIGVDWDDRILDHLNHARQRRRIATASLRQVTVPVHDKARYRWRHFERELGPVLPVLQPFIELYGY